MTHTATPGQSRTNRSLWPLALSFLGLLSLVLLLFLASDGLPIARAEPIQPPEGYPKLNLSYKAVDPPLANTGGAVLHYAVVLRNTGAYTAEHVIMSDTIPEHTIYNDDVATSVPFTSTFSDGVLTWHGDVGFDSSVVVSFSVTVDAAYSGPVRNTAVITHPLIADPVTVTVESMVTDDPLLSITKSSSPARPGPNKPMTYTLVVANVGQPATGMQLTVEDEVPADTALRSVGPDGSANAAETLVTWNRTLDLDHGQESVFTFSVDASDVPSGTVVSNSTYSASSPEAGVTAGEPYTVTVIDPILSLAKVIDPDPPGSNREATYTLTLLNQGSLATGLVISDRVPANATYVRGGTEADGIVSWTWPRLDTGASAQFTFTVYISDVMDVVLDNDEYGACSAEGVCVAGERLTSTVEGPTFELGAFLDPIAKKPGGGSSKKPVTPTLVLHNLGPGNAIDLQATTVFTRISVSATDLYAIPAIGTLPPFPPGPDCGENCRSYLWHGDLAHGETVTFTTTTGQSTIVGEEGTIYTTTLLVSDTLANTTTVPVSATAEGKITHFANVEPLKSAPPVIGRGEVLTYTIDAYNRGLSTQLNPILTDVVPLSTTFLWASDDGVAVTVNGELIVSWTLPLLGPGEGARRRFSVLVGDDLISGTHIVNADYSVVGYGNIVTDAITSGPPVTTTVKEVGLVDSYKEVTPTLAAPGSDIVLTYTLHVVNSSPVPAHGVSVYDLLPWASTTYRRDAVASAGTLVSDIVSIDWTGDVEAFSEETLTFTVEVDPDFEGPVTNTATIHHESLLADVVVEAVAYISNDPVLEITKWARPTPAVQGEKLAYTLRVTNLGQQATDVLISDTVPANTQYVPGSATAGGKLVGNAVQWQFPLLLPNEVRTVSFRVTVGKVEEVVNAAYGVTCAEGVSDQGPPLRTRVVRRTRNVYLPIISR
ncbi:MAG: hypothetical protein P8129_01225 [Anaerolineae bacterium]